MKRLKTAVFLLFTLGCIALGAALPGAFITVDDSTGKAVRMMVGYAPDSGMEEERKFWMEKWFAFLQEYYGPEAGIDYAPLLEIKMEVVLFNYPKDPTDA